VATGTFLTGLVLFLVAFASTDWLGIEEGLSLSLWRTCTRNYVEGDWRCEPWELIPGALPAQFCCYGWMGWWVGGWMDGWMGV
jgi:hypothetical protein